MLDVISLFEQRDRVHGHNTIQDVVKPRPDTIPWRPTIKRNLPQSAGRPRSASSDSNITRCPCGRPAIPGDYYCYSCRPD